MSRVVTRILLLLPALGLMLGLIGWREWYPEAWLDSKGFVINLASGITTACFGVPIAFFVLQKVLAQREERLRVDGVQARYQRVARLLVTTVRERLVLGIADEAHYERVDGLLYKAGEALKSMDYTISKEGVEKRKVARLLAAGGEASACMRALDQELILQANDDDIDTALTLVEHISATVNEELLREGWPPVPRNVLKGTREYLEWLRERSYPFGVSALPHAIELGLDWPYMKQSLIEASENEDEEVLEDTAQRLKKYSESIEDAREEARQIRMGLVQVVKFEAQLLADDRTDS